MVTTRRGERTDQERRVWSEETSKDDSQVFGRFHCSPLKLIKGLLAPIGDGESLRHKIELTYDK